MRPSACVKRDGLDLLHRRDPRGDDADGFIDRHHRPAKGKAIVGQLRHLASQASAALCASTSSTGIADRCIMAAIASISSRWATGSVVSTAASVAMPTMPGSSGNSSGLPLASAMHLDLAMRLALEAFDDDEIDRRHLCQQFRQPRLAGAAQFMHQRPAPGRGHQHLGRAGLPMHPGILAGHVDIEFVMGMLDDGDAQALARANAGSPAPAAWSCRRRSIPRGQSLSSHSPEPLSRHRERRTSTGWIALLVRNDGCISYPVLISARCNVMLTCRHDEDRQSARPPDRAQSRRIRG